MWSIKVCLYEYLNEKRLEILEKQLNKICKCGLARQCHIQTIYDEKYNEYLKSSNDFCWKTIIDFIYDGQKDESKIAVVLESIKTEILRNMHEKEDIFLIENTNSYGEAKDGAEVITSTYYWAKDGTENSRDKVMDEHFEMEKQQVYYSYVTFGKMHAIVQSKKESLGFMFEAYVNDPDGINQIYTDVTLMRMREHSKRFLNVDSRRLAFGKLRIVEGRK